MGNIDELGVEIKMHRYRVEGYDKITGQKRVIIVSATTSRHAKTVAYYTLNRPKVVCRIK